MASTERRPTSNGHWLTLALGVFGLWILTAIGTSLCLYADGAHEFVRVLAAQDFVSLMWSRHFAFYIFQFPLVLAIKLGVTQLVWLRVAFGLGCFLPWPLALLLCRWLARDHFWLAVAGCAAGYLNAAFLPVGEHILAHALFWPALFVLLFVRPLTRAPALVLLAMATGLQFSYESQIFLSAPLLALALWRSVQERRENPGWAPVVLLVAAGLFLVSMANGMESVWRPELPGNFTGFKAGTLGIFWHPGWTLTWTLLWGGLAAGACWSEKLWQWLTGKNGWYFSAISVLVWGLWPLLAPDALDSGLQHDNRALNLLVPMGLLPVALSLRFRPAWLSTCRPRLVTMVAALLLAQSLWHLTSTALWYRDVLWMQETLAAKRGIYPLRATVLAADGMLGRELYPDAMGGRFDWSWPCLSLALAPQRQIHCLIVSEVFLDPTIRRHSWQPFDPFNPATLPRLDHYGVDYTHYSAALSGVGP